MDRLLMKKIEKDGNCSFGNLLAQQFPKFHFCGL